MAPQDDLTAERAAKLAAFELVKKLTNHAGMDPNDRWDKANLLLAYRQAARQEALREARQLVSTMFDQQASELPDYYAALLDVGNALDRLASEGG